MAQNDPKEDPYAAVPADGHDGIDPGRWVRRIVLALVVLVVAYLSYKLAAAFFPRWWAHRVAHQTDDRLTAGVMWGLFYGFVFTLLPVLVLGTAISKVFNWAGKIVLAVVAVALAAPNWLTLSVVAGSSNAAHDGQRIMSDSATGFRAASAWGAVAGVILGLVILVVVVRLRHRRHQVKGLKQELKARDAKERSARKATDES